MIKQTLKEYLITLRQLAIYVILLFAVFTGTSCSPSSPKNKLQTPTIIRNISQNEIKVTIFKAPEKFNLAEDIYISIKVETPLGTTTTIPNLSPYCTGFKLISEFNTQVTRNNQRTTYTHYIRLRPEINTVYAIEPFSIIYKNRSYSPAVTGKINIPQIIFSPELQSLSPSDDIIAEFSPIQSSSTEKPRLIKIIAVLLFLLVIAGQFIRYHLSIKKSSMPLPRSNALDNLNKLLSSDLLSKNKFTEFYFKLTNIVRNYIEETLQIASTHQTSEELITNLQREQRLDNETVDDLTKFFQRADLIKFATITPSPADLANDIAWAKQYIESNLIEEKQEEELSC